MIASFGALVGDEVARTEIALPGFDGSLVVEVDTSAVQGLARVLRSLDPGQGDQQNGSFTHVDRALDELITMGEAQIGHSIQEMSRLEKRRLVRFLDERGAFTLRKSVETVAELLGVTRFTVYNYLDAVRSTGAKR